MPFGGADARDSPFSLPKRLKEVTSAFRRGLKAPMIAQVLGCSISRIKESLRSRGDSAHGLEALHPQLVQWWKDGLTRAEMALRARRTPEAIAAHIRRHRNDFPARKTIS